MDDIENRQDKFDTTVICSDFANALLETHCIVDKQTLKELYECYKQHEETCSKKGLSSSVLIAQGSAAAMRDIYGETLFEK